ncbi:Nodule-specific Glycine Rich Peptide [Medicago truncatula]|uniref:Nodule-specific Glycine Rich Peptide n=1 Tax=Medicago truncatula TaxID=3880 RepID=A0A072VH58_MEDTR|nr:Nodule-specific Glycine Rich Peptide [Medicago truncatula]
MMKTHHFVLIFFLCAEIIIYVVGIKSSRDGNQFGAAKESKTKIGINGWED